MARKSEGWTLKPDPRTGNFLVRFHHGGQPYKRSTRTSDRRRAKVEAARIYEEVVAGRVPSTRGPWVSDVDLALLFGAWLAAIEPEIDELTHRQYKMYCRAHWLPFFKKLSHITEPMAVEYSRTRLRKVRRKTVTKELSALRRFLVWAKRHGYMSEIPDVPSPPRSATGVDYDKGSRNKVRVELTEEEVEAVLAALPEKSRRHGNPVRAFFTAMYETSLRRGTLVELRAPQDYVKGSKTLKIREEIDKARYGREVPLSTRAREALDSVCPKGGQLFPDTDYRYPLQQAAKAAGMSDYRAHHLSYHDWRHAALTHMASRTNNLVGMAFLAGHKNVTTTAKYVHAHKREAERVLEAREEAREEVREETVKGDSEDRQDALEAPPKPGTENRFRAPTGHGAPKRRKPR